MTTAENILEKLAEELAEARDEQAGILAKHKHALDRHDAMKLEKGFYNSFKWAMHALSCRDKYADELRLCNERVDLLEHVIDEVKRIIDSDEEKKQ